jgi:hypothetical protein
MGFNSNRCSHPPPSYACPSVLYVKDSLTIGVCHSGDDFSMGCVKLVSMRSLVTHCSRPFLVFSVIHTIGEHFKLDA